MQSFKNDTPNDELDHDRLSKYKTGGKEVYGFNTDTDTELGYKDFDYDNKKDKESVLGNEADITRPPMGAKLRSIFSEDRENCLLASNLVDDHGHLKKDLTCQTLIDILPTE